MATSSAKAKPTQHLCVVTIGYMMVLMPADKGIKLVELLRGALKCEAKFEDRMVYEIGEELSVEYSSVKPGQVRAPKADVQSAGDGVTRIVHSPLRLTGGKS